MKIPEFIVEELQHGSVVAINGDPGDEVSYISLALGIQKVIIGPSLRFVPGFLIPNMTKEAFDLFKRDLQDNDPRAQEIRYFKDPLRKGHFLCSVYRRNYENER